MQKFDKICQKQREQIGVKSKEQAVEYYPYIILMVMILGLGIGVYSVKEDIMKQKLIKNSTRNNKFNLETFKKNNKGKFKDDNLNSLSFLFLNQIYYFPQKKATQVNLCRSLS